MKINDIYVEAPRAVGDDIEFFIQANEPHTLTCASHIHNAVELLYINEGSYTVIIDGTEYEAHSGDLLLFCSNTIHNVYTRGEIKNSYYVIKIPPSFFLSLSARDAGTEYVMRFALHRKEQKCHFSREELEGGRISAILTELIREHESAEYASEVAIKLKIMELLLTILREDAHSDGVAGDKTAEIIYRVMTYVRSHYSEDIDERALAASVGLSYSYFSRSFKRITGMTFNKYLNVTRINQAEKILCNSHMSISEVATACGYNSISYFISVFRTLTGRTPKAAMKDNRIRNEE
ncbi:MAG: helix-turn-helix transcriptional regulator [Clostridia bacterium]|nr:helix-turn-helix transcriptional regulator [Clostridia bacterium]